MVWAPLVNEFQEKQATDPNRNRDPEMHVSQHGGQPVLALFAMVDWLHISLKPAA
jgi:hypothetical protein